MFEFRNFPQAFERKALASIKSQRLIIGLGTGRCGTTSLAQLLSRQSNTTATHEYYGNRHTWIVSNGQTKRMIAGLIHNTNNNIVADVSFAWLNYVEQIQRLHPATRFICLIRPREEFIKSYLKLMRGRNNLLTWRENMGFSQASLYGYEHCLPKYDHLRGHPDEFIFGYFYDQYYEYARALEHSLSSFSIFPTDALNSEEGVAGILGHCGYHESIRAKIIGIRANTSPCHFQS